MDQRADTIPRLAMRAAERWPDRPAVLDRETVVTFSALADAARAVALGLAALGIGEGDRVAIWVPNRWEWVAAAIGIQAAGAVLVPLNTRLKGLEIADILRRTGTRALFSAGHFLGVFYPDMLNGQQIPALERVIVMDGDAGPGRMRWAEFFALGTQGSREVDRRIAEADPGALSDLMFTSGTTGLPKGAMFTHAQTVAAAVATVWINGLTQDDRYATFGPFSHNAAYKAGWVAGLVSGCAIVITTELSPDGVMDLIARRRVTVMPGPPPVWQGILDAPSRRDGGLDSLRLISTGGMTVPVPLVERLRREIGGAVVMTGYGLTECCGSATATRPDDTAEVVAATAGRAVRGTELRIADPDGRTLAAGEQGEILVRNASVTLGYLDDPAATRAAIDADGWLRTGDVGVLDAAGNLRITDRLRDMYIVGGFNCYPAEVEHLLANMPGVRQSAVIGVPDERLGQVGRAYVVAAPGAALTEAGVIAWCRKNMANYKAPRSVRFADALPMTASGKVMKRLLRDPPPGSGG